MPKSKRDKKISLTKVPKKNLVFKQKIAEDVRNCVEKFNSIYAFTYKNLRTDKLQDIRQEWKPSRFFFAKNRLIAIGLGRTAEEEVRDDLHKLTKNLKGQCGILFTNCSKEEVIEWFANFSMENYARSGFKATANIKLEEGPLKQFSHSLEPHLRKLGLPTKLDKGVITLIKEYEVCKIGTILTPEQARILKLLDYKMATFRFILRSCWIKDKGYEKFSVQEDNEDVEMEEDENNEDE